ncbi:DUF645 family protein [Vibrio cholerae]|nr:DUF645 family protein [Vibrio cholerae]EKF9575074.1 DUF645 family protein [Vibrio cholerae]MCR9661175.1 DUF645 family protein [Vibrio cholerae]MCR9691976.1 DUF645 family protein [Vibrio cholerae]MCR9705553.1 DUF645 family protein [Vibrio cholerae]MCR9739827.1 DUF645 family protein [Vibrio cholerae]
MTSQLLALDVCLLDAFAFK